MAFSPPFWSLLSLQSMLLSLHLYLPMAFCRQFNRFPQGPLIQLGFLPQICQNRTDRSIGANRGATSDRGAQTHLQSNSFSLAWRIGVCA